MIIQALLLAVLTMPATAGGVFYEGGEASVHAQCWSLGASAGRVEGLGGDLARLAGPDDGVILLEGGKQNFKTPYTSEELQLTLVFINDFSLLQGGYGMRFSTVPFPKVFLRPWVGAYLTLNLLKDTRGLDTYEGNEDYDGIGVGVAAAAGVTMRLTRSLALGMAVRGDRVFTAGWLDTGEYYKDAFGIRGAFLRLQYFFKE